MATRFNTFNTTNGLAKETTQTLIKDKLNNTLDVNVVTLPSGGGDTNIVAVASSILPSSHLPTNQIQLNGQPITVNTGNSGLGTQRVVLASDQPEVSQNLTQINGTAVSFNSGTVDAGCQRVVLPTNVTVPILPTGTGAVNLTQIAGTSVDQGIGNSSLGTQRVVLASDQPEVASNLTQINTTIIDQDTGNSSLGTQRVVLASDQPEVASNITQLNNNTISVGIGGTGLGLGIQRVIQVNDQQYESTASKPVIIKRNYNYNIHNDTYFTTSVAAANQFQCFYPPAGQQFYNATTQTFSATLFIPTVNTTAQIISSLPLADGLGLTGTLLYYTSASNPTIQSQFITISTLGYVAGNPGTTVSNFFRAITWIPGAFPVGFQANQGNITIVDDATGTLTYPGNIPISTNGWFSSLVYLPIVTNSDFDGTRIIGEWVLDNSSYHLDNPAGNDSRVAVWIKDSTSTNVWRQLIRFQIGSAASGGLGQIPLSNIRISSLVQGNDIMFSVSKETGGASIFLASAFGCHLE